MFSAVVRASETTDVDTAVADLRERCQRAGLPIADIELIAANVRTLLVGLVDAGKRLAGTGSQMRVTRVIAGDGYRIELIFGAGEASPWWRRLRKLCQRGGMALAK